MTTISVRLATYRVLEPDGDGDGDPVYVPVHPYRVTIHTIDGPFVIEHGDTGVALRLGHDVLVVPHEASEAVATALLRQAIDTSDQPMFDRVHEIVDSDDPMAGRAEAQGLLEKLCAVYGSDHPELVRLSTALAFRCMPLDELGAVDILDPLDRAGE